MSRGERPEIRSLWTRSISDDGSKRAVLWFNSVYEEVRGLDIRVSHSATVIDKAERQLQTLGLSF